LEAELESLIAVGAADESREVADLNRAAEQAARHVASLLALAACFALAVGLASGYFLSRSILRPIERLSAAAAAVGSGHTSFRVGTTAKDELGVLASRFDDMASQLQRQQVLLMEAKLDWESEVQSRTAELEQANERLRSVDRSRLQFMAEISHELRTPLTVLRGEAEVTLRGKDSNLESYVECLRGVVEQAREMSALVDDLLFLARSESDEIRFRNEILDLREVSAEAVREANILGRARHVRVEASVPAVAVIVDGDPQRMKQLLLVLLDNGIKYSAPNGVVKLDLEKDGAHALICVRNIGVGIGSEELPRIFEPFYRGVNAAATTSRGSGLGLSIAKWIVGRQGGSIALSKSADDVIQLSVRFPLALPSIGDNDMAAPGDFAKTA
jgi:signal transduction histidine kinase